jgi:tetratricopeptide (TPR) repeat protein
MPCIASFVYCTLGNAYYSLGNFSKAIEYHKEHLTMAKEVGDRAGESRAYGNFGNAYQSLGDFSKAIEYHTQDLAIAKEVGDRVGEGTIPRPSNTRRSTWQLQRKWATRRGQGVREPRE